MNKELIMALDALEKENGIDKEIMFAAIEKSLMDEYKAEFDKADNGRVELDRRTGDFHIYSDRTVVEEVIVPENRENKKEKYVSGTDIALEDARKIKPDCQLGDVITVEVKSEEHPGDGETVIKALPGQRGEVLHRLRGFVGEKHGLKDARRGVEHRDGVPRRRVGELQLCRLHRRAADALS